MSRLAAAALSEELDRQAKVAELDAYLAELERDLGPISEPAAAEARAWADEALAAPSRGRRST